MALLHPRDLTAWQDWQNSRNRLRIIRNSFRFQTPGPTFYLSSTTLTPRVLVAVDALTPTAVAAFLEPLLGLSGTGIAVISTAPLGGLLPEVGVWDDVAIHNASYAEVPEFLKSVTVVFSGGHYLPAGHIADNWANKLSVRHVVAQHGLLTPYAPPLPENAHALVFSEQDGEFWASGRSDVSYEVVGSQLLFRAAQTQTIPVTSDKPVFLGQLHGAELPRKISGGTAYDFCRDGLASYRPHPAEVDLQSRAQHAIWERLGVEVIKSPKPLFELGRPVVSVFSTGVLEAAAAGLPAWVTCKQPAPAWVKEFWQRYNMSVWGNEPTPTPVRPEVEPAIAVARSISGMI